jgi:hypothetical protein
LLVELIIQSYRQQNGNDVCHLGLYREKLVVYHRLCRLEEQEEYQSITNWLLLQQQKVLRLDEMYQVREQVFERWFCPQLFEYRSKLLMLLTKLNELWRRRRCLNWFTF